MKKCWEVFKKYWMVFAHKMGWFNEHVILGVVFFAVMSIYALPVRIWRFCQRPKTSTWKVFEHHPQTVEDLKHPF